MAIKVGINGFGRIGRVALRIMVERGSSSYQICGINLRNADLDYMVYQVKYDSVFRTFRDTVEHDDRATKADIIHLGRDCFTDSARI